MASGFEWKIHPKGTGDFHVFAHENHGIAVLVGQCNHSILDCFTVSPGVWSVREFDFDIACGDF